MLMEVYNKLSKVDEFLPLAKRERYLMTFRGKAVYPDEQIPQSFAYKLPLAKPAVIDLHLTRQQKMGGKVRWASRS